MNFIALKRHPSSLPQSAIPKENCTNLHDLLSGGLLFIQKPSRRQYNFAYLLLRSSHSFFLYPVIHSSAPESNKQDPRDIILDLPIFFRYKRIPSLKNLPLPAPNESSAHWFQGNFAASFVFNFCLREFLLSADANRFELRC